MTEFIYPEIQKKIDERVEKLLEECEQKHGEQSYAYVVGVLKSTIKWAIAQNDLKLLKKEFGIQDK